MKNFFVLIIIFALLSSCAPTQQQLEIAIQETQTVEVRLFTSTPADSSTPLPTDTTTLLSTVTTPLPTDTNTPFPADTHTPLPADTNTPLPTDTPAKTNTPTYTAKNYPCDHYFSIKVLEPPFFASVLEDNPPYYPFYGVFMIVKIRIVNHTDRPRWVWYSDYYMHGLVDEKPVLYQLDGVDDASLALENLFKTNPFQAEIGPLTTYDTMVAFDVNPAGENWNLTVMPDQLCKVTIPLENN